MNPIELITQMIYGKMKIQIPREKAEQILRLIQKNFLNVQIETAIQDLSKMIVLPPWITQVVTINETFFFRHPEHFTQVKEFVKRTNKPEYKLLCLGTSTGEEAYSLAMTMEESIKPGVKYTINAVDIDQQCIRTAKMGEYNKNDGQRVSEIWKKTFDKYTQKQMSPMGEKYLINENIKSKIQFSCSDIFQFVLDRYDIIFVRNILIYFSDADKIKIYQRLSSRMTPEGLIFIGAAELIPDGAKEFVAPLSNSILKKAG